MAKSKSNTASSVSNRNENPIVRYYNETRAELRKVTWPTREETVNLTIIIVTVMVVIAIFLGLLDFIFSEVVSGILSSNLLWVGIAVLLLAVGTAIFYFNGQQE